MVWYSGWNEVFLHGVSCLYKKPNVLACVSWRLVTRSRLSACIVHKTYTTGLRALPDIYTNKPEGRWTEGERVNIRQSTQACGISKT